MAKFLSYNTLTVQDNTLQRDNLKLYILHILLIVSFEELALTIHCGHDYCKGTVAVVAVSIMLQIWLQQLYCGYSLLLLLALAEKAS